MSRRGRSGGIGCQHRPKRGTESGAPCRAFKYIDGLDGIGVQRTGFSFNGYLPIDSKERERKLKELEATSKKADMTQIFIETPYRNNKMIESLISTLRGDTLVCVACDITDPEKETIKTMPASRWRKASYDFDKRPAIFLIYSH